MVLVAKTQSLVHIEAPLRYAPGHQISPGRACSLDQRQRSHKVSLCYPITTRVLNRHIRPLLTQDNVLVTKSYNCHHCHPIWPHCQIQTKQRQVRGTHSLTISPNCDHLDAKSTMEFLHTREGVSSSIPHTPTCRRFTLGMESHHHAFIGRSQRPRTL